MNKTTIAISLETKERLDKIGGKGDSYDNIIARILNGLVKENVVKKKSRGFFARLLQKRIWRK